MLAALARCSSECAAEHEVVPDLEQTIHRELLRYCAQDTGSTLHLVRWLESEAAKA